jgi:hypothetical protein
MSYLKYGYSYATKENIGKRDEAALKVLRKLPTVGTMTRKELTVTINGQSQVYTLGKGNEYFNGKISLTSVLETVAKGTGNKIQIA